MDWEGSWNATGGHQCSPQMVLNSLLDSIYQALDKSSHQLTINSDNDQTSPPKHRSHDNKSY